MKDVACPICHGGTLARGEGRLEQSGESYLPTVVWSCGRCGYARFESAAGKRWQPAERNASPVGQGWIEPSPPVETGQPRLPAAPARPRRKAWAA